MIAGSVDDRTEEERGLKVRLHTINLSSQNLIGHQPLKNDRYRIPKSRYDSVDLYIANDWANRPEYNDTYVPYDEAIFDRLKCHGEYALWSVTPH